MVDEDKENPDAGARPIFEAGEEARFHAISADGNCMLYPTERTGERQLHLTTFPRDPEQDWTVTPEMTGWGGVWFDEPRQRVLFVRGDIEGEKSLWSVSLELDPEVRPGLPEQVFAIPSGVRLEEFDPDSERWPGTSNEQPERVEVRMLRGWEPSLPG